MSMPLTKCQRHVNAMKLHRTCSRYLVGEVKEELHRRQEEQEEVVVEQEPRMVGEEEGERLHLVVEVVVLLLKLGVPQEGVEEEEEHLHQETKLPEEVAEMAEGNLWHMHIIKYNMSRRQDKNYM